MSKQANSLKKAQAFYTLLLTLYPEKYEKKFGEEMQILFCDLYQEKGGGLKFWTLIVLDTISGAGIQYIDELNQLGLRKFLTNVIHVNIFSIFGVILIMPFVSMLGIDFLTRIMQGSTLHPNQATHTVFSQTLFFQFPIVVIWALILPIIAVVLNTIPFVVYANNNKQSSFFSFSTIKQNFASFVMLGIGFSCLAVLVGHDFLPCTINHVGRDGFLQLRHILAVCKNA